MARIFTTPEAEQTARAWLHDLTLAAGLRTKNQRSNQLSLGVSRPDFINHAKVVCDELINREFSNVNDSIMHLSYYRFNAILDGSQNKWKSLKKEAVAKSIVYMAELLGLYWDDTVRTPYEIDEFKKTYLGMAVYKYGRYISAIPNKKTGSTKSSSSRAAGQPPKNNYKQSGPQSGNVRDLRDVNGTGKGTPGQKVLAGSSYIYKIVGDNPQSKNTPNVFIKPLSAAGAVSSSMTQETNKIFISSGNGYTDCTCYFDDPNDASDFLDKIIANNRVPANVTNLRVVKNKADANGYFLVGTEFGVCAISAKTLNEALVETLEEETTQVSGWEKATEGYSKEELNELHTWMRRG
jgi:hypothetical protein